MKVLVVFSHPRRDSFCGAVMDSFVAGLTRAGHKAEIADLHAEGFDPRMTTADEPDWDNPRKRYTDEVLAELLPARRFKAGRDHDRSQPVHDPHRGEVRHL